MRSFKVTQKKKKKKEITHYVNYLFVNKVYLPLFA